MKLDKQIKIGTQKMMAHKRNLKNGIRFDLKNQNSTTENIMVQKA